MILGIIAGLFAGRYLWLPDDVKDLQRDSILQMKYIKYLEDELLIHTKKKYRQVVWENLEKPVRRS